MLASDPDEIKTRMVISSRAISHFRLTRDRSLRLIEIRIYLQRVNDAERTCVRGTLINIPTEITAHTERHTRSISRVSNQKRVNFSNKTHRPASRALKLQDGYEEIAGIESKVGEEKKAHAGSAFNSPCFLRPPCGSKDSSVLFISSHANRPPLLPAANEFTGHAEGVRVGAFKREVETKERHGTSCTKTDVPSADLIIRPVPYKSSSPWPVRHDPAPFLASTWTPRRGIAVTPSSQDNGKLSPVFSLLPFPCIPLCTPDPFKG